MAELDAKNKIAWMSVLALMAAVFFAGGEAWGAVTKPIEGVPNLEEAETSVFISGPPSREGVHNAVDRGIRTIVDFRWLTEDKSAVQEAAEEAGVRYYNIPVTAETLREEHAAELHEIIDRQAEGPVLLHCASGNRAAGVWAYYLKEYRGLDPDEALERASELGLTPALRENLRERMDRGEDERQETKGM